ncbi:MAG: hypothetical protein LUE27_09915, partial [Clostridia bacterium]|nr:hypothetical protein [Clostridia bacterium]
MSIAKDCISLGAEVVSLARVEELCPETTTDYKAFEDAKDCYTDYNALRNIIFTKAIECLYKDDIRS